MYDTIDLANHNKLTGIMMAIDFRKSHDSIAFFFIKADLLFLKFSEKLIELNNDPTRRFHSRDPTCRKGYT